MNSKRPIIGVLIPTYNGGALWEKVVKALLEQRSDFDKILIIDSGSTDNTVKLAQNAGFDVKKIPSSTFDSGGTRNIGVHEIDCDIVVLLTQDSIPMENSISLITKAFSNNKIAVAYGRQIPHDNATPLAECTRAFNYKKDAYIYELKDKDKYGIKTCFSSDSFSAYNKKIFLELEGFPDRIVGGEDMYFAAKALLHGYKVCYAAKALCKHSHNYSPIQEFKRYFDVGVFHQDESWIRERFGKLKGEGIRFISSEFCFLWKNKNFSWIPISFINNIFKLLGYKLGLNYKKIPIKFVTYISCYKAYWRKA